MLTKHSFLSLVLTAILLLSLALPSGSALAAGGPVIWCPGSTLPEAGCSTSFSTFGALIAYLDANNTSGPGTIYVDSGYNAAIESGNITFDDAALDLTNLTIQGGWNFTTQTHTPGVSSTINGHGLIIGSLGASWSGTVTLNDLIVQNTSSRAVDIYATGDVNLAGLDSSGANSSSTAPIAAIRVDTTGNIIANDINVTNTLGTTTNYGSGAALIAVGTINLTNSTFNTNSGYGVQLLANISSTVANITASGNGRNGIQVISDQNPNAQITISNSTFSGNGTGLVGNNGKGIYMQWGNIDITPTVTASSNNEEGVYLQSASSVEVSGLTASTNGRDGLEVISDVNLNAAVTIKNSTFNGNGTGLVVNNRRGIYTHWGNIIFTTLAASGVTASQNGGEGVYLDAASSVDIDGLTANDNGINGAQVETDSDDLLIRNSTFNDNGPVSTCNETQSETYDGLFVEGTNGGTLINVTANSNTCTGVYLNSQLQSIHNVSLPVRGDGYVFSCTTLSGNGYHGLVSDLDDVPADGTSNDGLLQLRSVTFSANSPNDLPQKLSGKPIEETTECGAFISGNAGIAGATLTYVNVGTQTATADANGNYLFVVPIGWSGTVTPSKTGCPACVFVPTQRTYSNTLVDKLNQNYSTVVDVDVRIGGSLQGNYDISPEDTLKQAYPSVLNGPVRVVTVSGGLIFTSQVVKSGESYNELMGYPDNQLHTEYWFPWYDHGYSSVPGSTMRTWFAIGNPDDTLTADVDVYIGGVFKANYDIAPGGQATPRWIGLQDGPVRIVSTNGVDIFASQRVFTAPDNSFNESMGYPADQFVTEYWFPWYDSVYMNSSLMIGNTSSSTSANVSVYIGGVFKGSYVIGINDTLIQSYASLINGPVRVVSTNGVNIVVSQRVRSGPKNSYNEVMGYPNDQFHTEYWFPWYDHGYGAVGGSNMRTWLAIGNPHTSQTADVDVYIDDVFKGNYDIAPGGQVTPRWIGLQDGPVQIISTNGVDIFASQRVFTVPNSVFNEMLGFPADQLTGEYWFPWYDSINMSSSIFLSVP